VAVYKNIPLNLQSELDRLVSETYRKKLLTISLLEASLLLLSSGALPAFQSLNKRLKGFCPASCLEREQQRAIDFVTDRKPNDIVVMVLRSNRLIATITLFPFSKKRDIPSLAYLEVDSGFEQLPDAPSVEVGRLAKKICNGYDLDDPANDFTDMASMAAAFVVSKIFATKKGMLRDPKSFICGDTHGALITCLKRFFPLKTYNSTINPVMLEDDCHARGMSIYFMQRQILGSFESADDLLAAIRSVASTNPDLADRIAALLTSGLATLGIPSIHQFDPKRFKVHLFQIHFHHPETSRGFARMEQMIEWMTRRSRRPKKYLN
jgi:hypothetical protein